MYNVSQCSHQRGGPLVHAGERALLAGPGLLLLPLLPLLGEQLLEAVLLPPEAAHQLPRLAQLSCQPRHVSLGQTRYYCNPRGDFNACIFVEKYLILNADGYFCLLN